MDWNNTPNDVRISLWKKLREDLQECNTVNQLNHIAKFCSQMPIGSRTVDYYNPANWPSPWEILYHGSFCTNSISILMFYTLILLGREPTLYLVDDNGDIFLLPVIDNTYVMNYELGHVSQYNIMKNFKILQIFPINQINSIF